MSKRIAFIGSPGCGKSTCSAEVFVAFKKLALNTELVPEWVRRDIARIGAMQSVWEQSRVLQKHREEEMNFAEDVDFIIVDSGTLTPYFYAALYADKKDPRARVVVQDMYGYLLDDLYSKKYDHIFFVPRIYTDKAGVSFQDGVRYQTDDEVQVLENYMRLLFCHVHCMDNIHTLECPLNMRVQQVIKVVLGQETLARWNKLIEKETE